MGDTWPYGPPDRVGYNVLYNSVIAAGGNAIEADMLAAIGMAESGSDIRVINDTPATGDYSVGAFQINYLGSLWAPRTAEFGTPQQLIAAGAPGQARAALVILGQQGFSAWTTYTSGAYTQFLHGAGGAPPQTGPGGTGAGQPTLTEGSTGPAVSALQGDLQLLGHPSLVVDGQFGPATLAAVEAFQAGNKLTVDGVVGPITWAAITTDLQAQNAPANTPPPPPPSEPPGNIDGSTLQSWSDLASAASSSVGGLIMSTVSASNTLRGI